MSWTQNWRIYCRKSTAAPVLQLKGDNRQTSKTVAVLLGEG